LHLRYLGYRKRFENDRVDFDPVRNTIWIKNWCWFCAIIARVFLLRYVCRFFGIDHISLSLMNILHSKCNNYLTQSLKLQKRHEIWHFYIANCIRCGEEYLLHNIFSRLFFIYLFLFMRYNISSKIYRWAYFLHKSPYRNSKR